jgi:hypothetical protein
MPTKRTPINRPPRGRVTAECIDLFRRALPLSKQHDECVFRSECDVRRYEHARCPGCEEFDELRLSLGRLLGLEPHDEDLFCADTDAVPPFISNPEHYLKARRLRVALEQAAAAKNE